MRIVLAPNAFKESLDAAAVARAMARGLRRAIPGVEAIELPVADGGDGTADVLRRALGGRVRRVVARGPLGERRRAPIVRLSGGDAPTDAIEMAEIAGLKLVPPARRNPMKTSTEGIGDAIADCRRRGARRVIVGLGGSATVDGGSGMARALGFRLLDARGRDLPPGGGALEKLARIVPPADWERIESEIEIRAACDVKNPLLGPRGAAAVFGPQKGATPATVERLEAGLARLDECWRRDLGRRVARWAGAGAAGGLGGGLAAFLNAPPRSGAALVLETVGFDRAIRGADWVITGEGRLDAQTLEDKAPAAVALAAARARVPTIALAGSVAPEMCGRAAHPFAACFSILSAPTTLSEARADAATLIERASYQIGRLLAAGTGL